MRIDRMVIRAGGLSREAATELGRRVAAEMATVGGAAELATAGGAAEPATAGGAEEPATAGRAAESATAGGADRDRITVRLTAGAGVGELAGRAVADLRRQLGRVAP